MRGDPLHGISPIFVRCDHARTCWRECNSYHAYRRGRPPLSLEGKSATARPPGCFLVSSRRPVCVWGGAPRSCENVCYPGMVTYHKIYSPHLKIAHHPCLPEILRHPEDGEHHLEIAADLEMGGSS